MSQTKHQHYISQVEQRLNTSTPNAKPENQRIFSFDLIDRDIRIVRLTHQRGRPIASNLGMYDLYSFDLDKDAATRANLEREFGQYETVVRENTEGLMRKFAEHSDDCKEELLTLFLAKSTICARSRDSRALIAKVTASRRAVVIGASFIGLEVAAYCVRAGSRCTSWHPRRVPWKPCLGPKSGIS